MTPWTVARQAPLTMGFPRGEYWCGLPFPSPGDLPPGIKPASPALAGRFFTTEPPGKSNCLLKPLQFCQSPSFTHQTLIIFPWKCLSRATLSPPLPNNPSSLILNYKCFCIPQIAVFLWSPLIHFDALFSSSASPHLLARLYGPICGLTGSPHLEGLHFFIPPSRILACLYSSTQVFLLPEAWTDLPRHHSYWSKGEKWKENTVDSPYNLPCSFQRKRNWDSRTVRYSQCP